MTATKDWANIGARADVVVDGQVLLSQVPVPYLLFLEKQLTDLSTFVRKLPVLDASESWNLDPSSDSWKTEPVRTIRTKKVPRNHVRAEAPCPPAASTSSPSGCTGHAAPVQKLTLIRDP